MMNELIGAAVQVIVLSLLPFLVWFFTARGKEAFLPWIGLRRPSVVKPAATLLLSIAAAAVYIAATAACIRLLPEGVTTAGSQFGGRGLSALPAVLVYAFVRTALSEEILFRGFILKRLQARFGFGVGNTVQALLFGLLHGIPFGLLTGSAAALVLLTLLPGLIGWYMGWLDEKRSGGSIVPGWLLHGLVNFLSGISSL